MTELLKQAQYQPLSISLMAASIYAVNKGFLDDIGSSRRFPSRHGLHQHLKTSHAALLAKLENDKAMDKDAEAELNAAIQLRFKRASPDLDPCEAGATRSPSDENYGIKQGNRGKIKSVENTREITKAMEMVAASKMRKAQDRMRAAVPMPRSGQHRGNLNWPRPTPSTATPSW